MQDFHIAKAGAAQQLALKQDRPRRVIALDIGVDSSAIFQAFSAVKTETPDLPGQAFERGAVRDRAAL